MGGALARLGLRLSVIGLAVGLLVLTPLPQDLPRWVEPLVTGVGVVLVLCLLGKLLYDTLFYERYWP